MIIPDEDLSCAEVNTPPVVLDEALISLTHKLTAPPAAPQVSGRVIQASVWTPRSTHCLRERSKLSALFTCEQRNNNK